jgi:hypothetical protein
MTTPLDNIHPKRKADDNMHSEPDPQELREALRSLMAAWDQAAAAALAAGCPAADIPDLVGGWMTDNLERMGAAR